MSRPKRLQNSLGLGLAMLVASAMWLTACSAAKVNSSSSLLGKNFHPPEPVPVETGSVRLPVQSEGERRVQNTLEALQRFDRTGRNRRQGQVYFELPESDINDYLAYSLHTVPRPGLSSVTVKLQPQNHVSVRMVLNFDRIAAWAPLIPSLLQLSGNQAIDMDLVFNVQDAAVTVQLADGPESTAMFRRAIQTLLHILAIHQPERYDTSKAIPLPYGLQRLSTTKGMVVGGT